MNRYKCEFPLFFQLSRFLHALYIQALLINTMFIHILGYTLASSHTFIPLDNIFAVQVEELRADLQDVKSMYREQVRLSTIFFFSIALTVDRANNFFVHFCVRACVCVCLFSL